MNEMECNSGCIYKTGGPRLLRLICAGRTSHFLCRRVSQVIQNILFHFKRQNEGEGAINRGDAEGAIGLTDKKGEDGWKF